MNFTREDIITIDNFLELEDFNKTLDLSILSNNCFDLLPTQAPILVITRTN